MARLKVYLKQDMRNYQTRTSVPPDQHLNEKKTFKFVNPVTDMYSGDACVITREGIKTAVINLKSGKGDRHKGFMSNYFTVD